MKNIFQIPIYIIKDGDGDACYFLSKDFAHISAFPWGHLPRLAPPILHFSSIKAAQKSSFDCLRMLSCMYDVKSIFVAAGA